MLRQILLMACLRWVRFLVCTAAMVRLCAHSPPRFSTKLMMWLPMFMVGSVGCVCRRVQMSEDRPSL